MQLCFPALHGWLAASASPFLASYSLHLSVVMVSCLTTSLLPTIERTNDSGVLQYQFILETNMELNKCVPPLFSSKIHSMNFLLALMILHKYLILPTRYSIACIRCLCTA